MNNSPDRRRRRAIEFAALFLTIAIVVSLWIHLGRIAKDAAEVSHCRSNLFELNHALANYHVANGSFPPAYIADAHGKRLHSWRILILPYFNTSETQQLYDQYDFTEPWNGPHNSKLATSDVSRLFRCPSAVLSNPHGANYFAVTAPGTVWPGPKSSRVSDAHNSDSTTIQLVEVTDSGIHWMEPRDLTLNEALAARKAGVRRCISSEHDAGPNFVRVNKSLGHFDGNPTKSQFLLK